MFVWIKDRKRNPGQAGARTDIENYCRSGQVRGNRQAVQDMARNHLPRVFDPAEIKSPIPFIKQGQVFLQQDQPVAAGIQTQTADSCFQLLL